MQRVLNAMDGVRFAIGNKGLWLIRIAVLSTVALSRGNTASYFSETDRDRIESFWNHAGRFTVSPPKETFTKGPWVVRLTPEGSTWLYKFESGRGIGKGANPRPNLPSYEVQRSWEQWVNQKVSFDRYIAGKSAAEINYRFVGHSTNTMPLAEDPGPEPDSLRAFMGDAPSFAAAVVPNEYVVTFEDGSQVKMADNPAMRPNYPYYRFAQGVMFSGEPVKSIPPQELGALFTDAGISPSEAKVMKAVSCLEGGFDSINTYDTGFVSVGMIQFACLSKGAGSLGQVLLREKEESPSSFEFDFHRYGLDVTSTGSLVALDIDRGYVLEGTAAAKQIINDKRLVAVFEHAGQKSRAFRVAQLQVAKEQYYPSQDLIAVKLNGQVTQCHVGEVVRSEAGLATLMDRKVNTGRIDPLPALLNQVSAQYGCRTADELASHERDVVAAMKLRKDYLSEPELTQPGGTTARVTPMLSRHGGRRARR